MLKLSTCAVLRLMTSSNLLGCLIGSSRGSSGGPRCRPHLGFWLDESMGEELIKKARPAWRWAIAGCDYFGYEIQGLGRLVASGSRPSLASEI